MKKLEWTHRNRKITKEEEDRIINLYLEKHNKKSNCWWSQLNPYWFGRGKIKDFIESIHRKKFNGEMLDAPDTFTTLGTAKICPAVGKGILDKSFLIKAPTDFCFSINPRGEVINSNPDDIMSLKIETHSPNQYKFNWDYTVNSITDIKDSPFDGYGNVKFMLPISIRTNNVPYIFLQPQYHYQKEYNENITVMNGLVEGKYTNLQSVNVNVLVKLPEEGVKTIFVKQGTVLAYIWFPENLKLVRGDNMGSVHQLSWTSTKRSDNV